MPGHGLIVHERRNGGHAAPRYLNSMGQWASGGKRAALLVWADQGEAARAATAASTARRRPVTVTTVSAGHAAGMLAACIWSRGCGGGA